MPVGRFVLDVHGEDRRDLAGLRPAVRGLQMINHLQDCGKDYRGLDRVYLPLDGLAAHGAARRRRSAAEPRDARRCARCLAELADAHARPAAARRARSPTLVDDRRLALEIAAIPGSPCASTRPANAAIR